MDKRQKDLSELNSFIEGVEKEVTMILQSLQWDRKHIEASTVLVACRYDANHKIPPDKKEQHERECFIKSQGYIKEDKLLPDILDPSASTAVKLSTHEIQQIINKAAQTDPMFKRAMNAVVCIAEVFLNISRLVQGVGPRGCEPLSAGRLQVAYTADERRAIHDAVVQAAPAFDYLDLALPSTSKGGCARPKSKLEVLSELRDMKRRRARYRGSAAASNNYSHVLRDLIQTQMEIYTGVPREELTNSNSNNVPRHHQEHRDKSNTSKASATFKFREVKVEKPFEEDEINKEVRADRYKEKREKRSRSKDRKRYDEGKERERKHYRGDREREKHLRNYEIDDNKYKYEDYDRNGTSIKKEKDTYSKHRDRRKDKEYTADKYSEYERGTFRGGYDKKNERSYPRPYDKFQDDACSSSSKRSREHHSDRKHKEDQHYKRYYDTKRDDQPSFSDVKRRKHS